jgi:hypothetical protein
MTLQDFFDTFSPKDRNKAVKIFFDFPELLLPSIARLERKIKAVKENDKKALEKIFLEEKEVVQKIIDQMSSDSGQEKIKAINS